MTESTTTPVNLGLNVTLGGKKYVMPALNAAAAKRYWDRMRAMELGTEPDPIGLTVTLVTACLRRNYPEVTEDLVSEHVDMDNMDMLSAAVFGRGAFRNWTAKLSAEAARGNALALQPMATAGTGAPSMPASPPPPAGDTPTSMS